MVVAVSLRVVSSRCSWVVNTTDQSQLGERVENSIDGSSRDLRVPLSDYVRYLIRSGVVIPLQQHLEDGTPLSRQGQPSLAAHVLKSLELLGDVHTHNVTMYDN